VHTRPDVRVFLLTNLAAHRELQEGIVVFSVKFGPDGVDAKEEPLFLSSTSGIDRHQQRKHQQNPYAQEAVSAHDL